MLHGDEEDEKISEREKSIKFRTKNIKLAVAGDLSRLVNWGSLSVRSRSMEIFQFRQLNELKVIVIQNDCQQQSWNLVTKLSKEPHVLHHEDTFNSCSISPTLTCLIAFASTPDLLNPGTL